MINPAIMINSIFERKKEINNLMNCAQNLEGSEGN